MCSSIVLAQQSKNLFEQSVAKADQGRLLDAQVLIDKAISLDRTNINYYLWKSSLSFKQRDLEGAFQTAYLARALAPENQNVYNEISNLYHSVNMCDSAIAMLTKAIYYAKSDSSIYNYLGNMASTKRSFMDYEGALIDLQQVINFNPDDVVALNTLAIIYTETGRTEEAISYLKKASAIRPDLAGFYVNLARLYTKIDRYEEALPQYEQAIALSPDEALIYSNRGELYYRMKQYDKAIVDINKSIDMYPTNSYAYRNRALVYLALDKQEESCHDLAAAEYYGFATNYGKEVKQLIQKNCQRSSKLSRK